MKLSRLAIFWAVLTLFLAGLTAFVVASWVVKWAPQPVAVIPLAQDGSEQGFHAWLHENLKITQDQHDRLLPHEEKYEEERQRLREKIRAAGQLLATTIRENDRDSPQLAAALQDLNQAQGELQQVTLDHFFTMKEHLSPEQAERLLQWTHDNIIHGYGY